MATSSVTLINRRRLPLTLNLPYRVIGDVQFCQRQVVGRLVVDPRTGKKGVKAERLKLSSSLSLRGRDKPGSVLTGLPLSVRKSPDVIQAEKAGHLRVLVLTAEETAQQQTEVVKQAEREAEHKKQLARRAEKLRLRAGGQAPPSSDSEPEQDDDGDSQPPPSDSEPPPPPQFRSRRSTGRTKDGE